MANDDVSVLRIVGRYQQQNCVSSLHYQHSNQEDNNELETLQALITAWQTACEAAWLAVHIDTYTLVGYKAFRVTGAAKVPAYTNREQNGTVDDAEVPSNICRTITLFTTSANHRRRGRVMLSGSGQSMFNQADGSVTTAEVAILQTLGDLLETTLVDGNDEWDIVLPATDALPVENVVRCLARVTPSTLKSRRVKQYLIG